jgi:purine-binding chemotaxis protein CheW
MNSREKVHTPRSMAAVLNPDVERAAETDSGANPVQQSQNADSQQRKARSLRELVGAAVGSMELVLFHVATENFAVPLASVREAIDSATLHQLPDLPPNVIGLVSINGRSLPLYDGRRFLGVAGTAAEPSVLIMRGETGDAGLAADNLLGSFEIELSRIRRVASLDDADGAFVGVFLHEGNLVTLLDPAAFARDRSTSVETA